MEEEGRREGSGEEGHRALGGEVPAGEAETFSLGRNRCDGDTPYLPPFPRCRHTDVGEVTSITNFDATRVRRLFDSQGKRERQRVFYSNRCEGILSRLFSSQGNEGEQENKERAEESGAVDERA